jgi:DNA-directed RNA polymerase subunit RPC12/RpoP
MPIIVPCPSCGARVRAPDAAAGKVLPCPRCKSKMVVPAETIESVSPSPPVVAAVEAIESIQPSPPKIAAAAPIVEALPAHPRTALCPFCREEIKPDAVKCKHCGERITPQKGQLDKKSGRTDPRGIASDGEVGFVCPFCKTTKPPIVRSRISTGGWLVIFFGCIFLSWIGLMMRESYSVCRNCHIRLG